MQCSWYRMQFKFDVQFKGSCLGIGPIQGKKHCTGYLITRNILKKLNGVQKRATKCLGVRKCDVRGKIQIRIHTTWLAATQRSNSPSMADTRSSWEQQEHKGNQGHSPSDFFQTSPFSHILGDSLAKPCHQTVGVSLSLHYYVAPQPLLSLCRENNLCGKGQELICMSFMLPSEEQNHNIL